QRPTEDTASPFVEGGDEPVCLAVDHQLLPPSSPEAIVPAVGNSPIGARVRALGAEEAPPQIDRLSAEVDRDGAGRAGVGTERAAGSTLGRVDSRMTPEPVGERRLTVGVADRATALAKAGDERFQHCGPFLEVMPTVRQVEALVAEREVGDLLTAQGHGEPHPIVEGGIDDLVAREMPLVVRRCDMADLSAPALDEAEIGR